MHLSTIFEPNLREVILKEEKKLPSNAITPATLNASAKSFTVKKIRAVISELNPRNAPGYVHIPNQVLQKLLEKGIKFINAVWHSLMPIL